PPHRYPHSGRFLPHGPSFWCVLTLRPLQPPGASHSETRRPPDRSPAWHRKTMQAGGEAFTVRRIFFPLPGSVASLALEECGGRLWGRMKDGSEMALYLDGRSRFRLVRVHLRIRGLRLVLPGFAHGLRRVRAGGAEMVGWGRHLHAHAGLLPLQPP